VADETDKCAFCDEPAEVVLILANLQGELLDRAPLCKGCREDKLTVPGKMIELHDDY
jgi:hypothetical protein